MSRRGLGAALLLALGAAGATLASGSAASASAPDATSAAPPAVRLPAHETYALGNGLPVTAMPLEGLPLVTLRLELWSGSGDDPPGREGLAALTARLLTKGTAQRNATEFAEAAEFEGGRLSADAGTERTIVDAEFLAEDLELAVDLLADAVLHPTFAADEVERAREQSLAEIRSELDEPSALASRRFREALFAGHPFGHAPQGTATGVAAVSRRDLKEFHERHFVPSNAHLVIVGRFDRAALRRVLEKRFGSWRGEPPARPPRAAPTATGGRRIVLVDKADATQTQIRLGNLGVPRNHPAYFPLLVGNTVLGGGFTSRLVNEVRVNRGLTYSISSSFVSFRTTGMAQISTFTKNESVRQTIDVVLEEARKVREQGITAAELAAAKSST